MSTPFETVTNRFFRMIEEDRDFFQYFSLTDDAAMALAKERAYGYLMDAADRIMMETQPEIDFTDMDHTVRQFNADLTSKEIFLVASLMYEYYMKKDVSKIKVYEVNYTANSLKVFSPSEARNSFLNLYKEIQAQNELLLDQYRNTDRETGAFKAMTHESLEEGEV